MYKYKIVRFYRNRKRRATGVYYETLKEAQAHCSKESTHKLDKNGDVIWFDGYTDIKNSK